VKSDDNILAPTFYLASLLCCC